MIEYRSLNSGEESKLEVAIERNPRWAIGTGREKTTYLRDHVFGEHNYDPTLTQVAVEGDEIVVQPRIMNSANGLLNVGGIALVGTVPEHQRKGHATKLLEMVIADLTKRGYDASILFTKNPFFTREGSPWKVVPRGFAVYDLLTEKEIPLLKQFTELNDSATVHLLERFYHEQSLGESFTVQRSHEYWINRLPNKFMFPKSNFVLLVDTDGHGTPHTLHGYAICEVSKNAVILRELNYRRACELDDLLVAASNLARREGKNKIGVFGPVLNRHKPTCITDRKDGQYVDEDLMMVPLKAGIEVPTEPITFWSTDHF